MTKPRWQELFDDFVGAGNPEGPYHSHDKVRWCEFVCATMRARKPFSRDEVQRRLLEAQFRPDVAEEFADKYEAQREILLFWKNGPSAIYPPLPQR